MTPSCWRCGFQTIGGHLTFLGKCGWFETRGREARAIPGTVVDEGCKFFLHDPARYWNSHEVAVNTDLPLTPA
jgi:hypothetical protein